jgi:mono/diheme cytochrome c family protein
MLTLAVALAMATSSYGQHSFTPEDIVNGGQLYRSNCLSCHGPSGDAVSNSPLMNGKFRRGNSDEELIKIIRNGISGTAMAAQPSLNEVQAGTIIGFLRSVAISIPSTSASSALSSGDSSVSRSNVRDVVFKSPMPSYREKLSPQELADVVSYLATLRGQTN